MTQQPYQPYPGYPEQPQSYAPPQQAPQYAPQPGYPTPPQPPQAQFQPPQYPQPPAQQGYGQPQPGYAPPPAPEQPRGTLNDFMNQPATGGGPSLSFMQPGTRYVGTVLRNVTDADIEPQTDPANPSVIAKYNDGRIKYIMKVPLLMQPSAAYPEGVGVWYIKGNNRAELARAMEAAGADSSQPPKAGDIIDITFTHEQANRRGMNPTKVLRVQYTQGNGLAPELPPAPQPGQMDAMQQVAQGQSGFAPQTFQPQPPPTVQYAPQGMPQMQYAQAPVQQYAPPAPVAQQIDQVYQQATGQYQPPQGQFMQPGGASPAMQAIPQPGQYASPQQAPFPTPGAAPAPGGYGNGAPQTAPASPSSPQPPADWPEGVPFEPGLSVQQAQTMAAMRVAMQSGQMPPQQ